MSSDTLLAAGTTVAGYEIDTLLGQGGMAVVYRATQRSLKRSVALKLLAAELSGDAEFRERFEREGQLQAAIDHQHIVPVYEAGQSEHGLFLAMRLIAGPTLKQVIQSGELTPRRTLRLLAQVAQALDAAHAVGLIHRDVKPQNILVGDRDHVYLADFGLIKAPDEVRLTGTGQFMGTIDYVAPEQIRGEAAQPPADCYALAAVLYECLTGEVPFPRASEAAVLQAQLTEPPPRVTQRRPDLPPALDDVIAAGLAKNPAERPSPVVDMIRAAFQTMAEAEAAQPGTAGQPAQGRGPQGDPQSFQPTLAHGTVGDLAEAAPAAGSMAPTVASPTVDGAQAATAAPGTAAPAGERRRAAPLAIAGVLAVIAIVAGFLIGHSGKGSGPAANSNLASVGHLALSYPSGWQPRPAAAVVPGMTFTDPVTLAGAAGGTLTAGEVATSGPTLLSPGFARRLSSPLPHADHVLLGKLAALRYAGVSVRGLSGPATVYAVPTTAGVATLVCQSPATGAPAFSRQCGEVATTLRLVGASAYPLGPSAAFARLVSKTLGRVRASAAAPQRALASARVPSAQAAAARSLSTVYARAANGMRSATVTPQSARAQAAIAASLARVSSSYGAAGAAAARGSSSAYARAGRQVTAAQAALAGAVSSLSKLGYKVS